MGTFAGKVALVTGAGNGIGRASAMMFAREDAKVVIADVVVEAGEQTAQLIQKGGGEAIFVAADVSDANQVSALVAKTVVTSPSRAQRMCLTRACTNRCRAV
jgi:NAD(P)-dependent dehydrogenase (short-subunit alcohol dehydrogenase family)